LHLQPVARLYVQGGIRVCGVDQNIGVDHKQAYRPSIAWYSASRSATSTSAPPL
jgi:hypothetical protein